MMTHYIMKQKNLYVYNANDLETCYRKLEYSRVVMETYETLRKDGGIIFSADAIKRI